MHIQPATTQAWLVELANVQAEIAAYGMPSPAPRPAGKRTRKVAAVGVMITHGAALAAR